MIKLAILGIENSHSYLFSSVVSPKEGPKMFDDLEVIGVYGDQSIPAYQESKEELLTRSTVSVFADDKDAFLDEADAVMVTACDGANHLKYAENYIKKGIPVWIDKPITRSVEDAVKMVELADKYGAVLSGGSSLEFNPIVERFAKRYKECVENDIVIFGGNITAPVNFDNTYGGFWFYTQHLVGMMTTVFGVDVKSVRAMKHPGGVYALYQYEKFAVTAFYGAGYSVSLYTGQGSEAEGFGLHKGFHIPEIKTFYEVIKTGKSDKTAREFVAPVYILDATIRAYETNKEVTIDIPFK
ncbi:MAG: Gfo/Idh/MocA family oxidoreductase [Clostridia bacterium]|nr:Gfo/Idh/MocA family oxidoreductase [Clostridia bacterium]